jgi:periplasmic protein TonB
MKPKKNPDVDPKRNSFLYFQIGLVSILLLTYLAIELKTYDKQVKALTSAIDDAFLDEEVPMTQHLNTPPPPPPPPPPAAPEVIKVVENNKVVEETKMQTTETNQKEIVKVAQVVEVEDEVDVDVPFSVIEDVPLFPGCEKVSKDQQRDCFNQKIQEHIKKNFQYPEIAQEMGIQGRVNVMFTIDKDGSITNVKMRGPDANLEKEAARIISKLPKMIPGKQRGKPVRVPFSVPITFRLN